MSQNSINSVGNHASGNAVQLSGGLHGPSTHLYNPQINFILNKDYLSAIPQSIGEFVQRFLPTPRRQQVPFNATNNVARENGSQTSPQSASRIQNQTNAGEYPDTEYRNMVVADSHRIKDSILMKIEEFEYSLSVAEETIEMSPQQLGSWAKASEAHHSLTRKLVFVNLNLTWLVTELEQVRTPQHFGELRLRTNVEAKLTSEDKQNVTRSTSFNLIQNKLEYWNSFCEGLYDEIQSLQDLCGLLQAEQPSDAQVLADFIKSQAALTLDVGYLCTFHSTYHMYLTLSARGRPDGALHQKFWTTRFTALTVRHPGMRKSQNSRRLQQSQRKRHVSRNFSDSSARYTSNMIHISRSTKMNEMDGRVRKLQSVDRRQASSSPRNWALRSACIQSQDCLIDWKSRTNTAYCDIPFKPPQSETSASRNENARERSMFLSDFMGHISGIDILARLRLAYILAKGLLEIDLDIWARCIPINKSIVVVFDKTIPSASPRVYFKGSNNVLDLDESIDTVRKKVLFQLRRTLTSIAVKSGGTLRSLGLSYTQAVAACGELMISEELGDTEKFQQYFYRTVVKRLRRAQDCTSAAAAGEVQRG